MLSEEAKGGVTDRAALTNTQGLEIAARACDGTDASVSDQCATAEREALQVSAGPGYSPSRELAAAFELHLR